MKFMILVKSNPSIERDLASMTEPAMKASMARMEAFNDELRKAGVMRDGDGLQPSKDGKRAFSRRSGGRLLDLGAAVDRGRGRVGQTLPESDAGTVGD